MRYRIAGESDLATLAAMRWDFRLEESQGRPGMDREEFIRSCTAFLRQGLATGNWTYWVAEEENGTIVAHVFVQRIRKVPKPRRLDDAFGYVTNTYTRPAYRGQGIGAALMAQVQAWAREQDLEMLIVWPSERSVPFYGRLGFAAPDDVLICPLRPYVK